MALDPVNLQINTTPLNSTSKNGLENNISKPKTLLDDLNPNNNPNQVEDNKKEGAKSRDSLALSSQAQQFLQSPEVTLNQTPSGLVINAFEKAAVEFRGLQQVSKVRELTPKESEKITQIKSSFAEAGIDEAGINKIADRRIQQIQQEAPQIVQQFNSGEVSANLFVRLNQVNESLNKANGFGVTDQDFKAPVEEVARVKSEFNSLVEVTKDRQLSQRELANLESLSRQVGTIQGFQINIRNSIGQDGLLA